jgi:hypothetical protein
VHERMSASGRLHKAKRGRPCSGPPEERLNGEPHFIERKEEGSSACVVCKANKLRKETIYYYKRCSKRPFLHPDKCFELYHTVKGLMY